MNKQPPKGKRRKAPAGIEEQSRSAQPFLPVGRVTAAIIRGPLAGLVGDVTHVMIVSSLAVARMVLHGDLSPVIVYIHTCDLQTV